MTISSLRDETDTLRRDVERLEHELVLQKQRADAAEQNSELMFSAHEANLKLLDHMVITHGIRSAAR